MLLMLEKPRRSAAERGFATLKDAGQAILRAVDTVALWPFRAAENRRIVLALASMSDHELRDVGLSRQDLRDVMALPATLEAGRFLSRRRDGRRTR